MRALVISNMYPSAGSPAYGIFVAAHVERMRALGVQVELVASGARPQSDRERVEKYLAQTARSALSALRPVDLVHLHYLSAAHAPAALPHLRPRAPPLLVTLHGGDVTLPPLTGARRALVGAVLRRAAGVVAVSEWVREKALELGADPARTEVISMGCDLELFEFSGPERRGATKRALGLDPSRPLALVSSELIPRKGVELALAALADPRLGALALAIAGDGPERGRLEQAARGLGARVRFLGVLAQRQLARWYRAADLFLFPTRDEPLGLVTLEAMASGAPVLAADVGGVPEVVRHGENGLLFPVGDAAALAALAAGVLAEPERADRLAQAGRRTAEAHALSRQVERVLALYRALGTARARPWRRSHAHSP
jgi:glycosyltransferase involved in cell wall biosynthesis